MRAKLDRRLPVWFVVFCNVEEPKWWQKLLKPGFQHVFAFTYDAGADTWLLFDPGWRGIVVRAIPKHELTGFLTGLQGPGITILKTPLIDGPVRKARLLMACSSQICHLLGLDLLVHTPYRIFVALHKAGAERAFEVDHGRVCEQAETTG